MDGKFGIVLSLIFRRVIFFAKWKPLVVTWRFENMFSVVLLVLLFFVLIFHWRRREWLGSCWKNTVRSKRYTGQRLWGDCRVQVSFFVFYRVRKSQCKIPKFHLISWCGNFAETHSFRRVSGEVMVIEH